MFDVLPLMAFTAPSLLGFLDVWAKQ